MEFAIQAWSPYVKRDIMPGESPAPSHQAGQEIKEHMSHEERLC